MRDGHLESLVLKSRFILFNTKPMANVFKSEYLNLHKSYGELRH